MVRGEVKHKRAEIVMFHFISLRNPYFCSDILSLNAAPCLKMILSWFKIEIKRFLDYEVLKLSRLLFYTNHSSLAVGFGCCMMSWPINDLRLTDGPSIDVASRQRLKFLGIVWLPFIPFSPSIIFSDGKRVVCSRGNVECFEPFVALMFVW